MNLRDFERLYNQGKKEFFDLDLSKVNMWDFHHLEGFTFNNCNLSKTRFFHTKLYKTSFDNCNLSEVNFTHPNLKGASFYGANLQNAFFDSTIPNTYNNTFLYSFSALIRNNVFKKAFYIFLIFLFASCVLPVLFAGYFIAAIFWGSILYGCWLLNGLSHISFQNVDFRKADLTGAKFGGSFIHGAKLTGAKMPNGKIYAPYHYFFIWD